MAKARKKLVSRIVESSKRPDDSEPEFLPTKDIDEFTTESQIKEVLQGPDLQLHPRDVRDLINCIQERPAKKVFLTLVKSDMLPHIRKLLSTGLSDGDLPIIVTSTGGNHCAESAREPSNRIEFFESLGDSFMLAFETQQWRYLAPVFHSSQFEYNLNSHTPLPLIEKGPRMISGFSSVRKVRVHRDHIDGKAVYLAMKQLEEMNDHAKYLQKESSNLKVLRHLDDANLIKPVATCVRGTQALFFFPWAEGGNLRDFWKKTKPRSDTNTELWILEQMTGLSRALSSLAAENCRHSDLKPENILHFGSDTRKGTLKITDVGLSKFHLLVTSRRVDGTTANHATERYYPPEFDPEKSNRLREFVEGTDERKLSRRFDIWSLGCVFVEFLIWARLGQEELERFNSSMGRSKHFWKFDKNSNTYCLYHKAMRWVTKVGETFQETPGGSVLEEVLALVEEIMLVTDWERRGTASQVHGMLTAILQKARSKSRHLLDGATRSLGLTGEQALGHPLRVQRLPAPEGEAASHDTDPVELLSSGGSLKTMPTLGNTAAQNYNTRQSATLQDNWTVQTDNKFAQSFFSRVGSAAPGERSLWCDECSTFRIWESGFSISGAVREFSARSLGCDLCKLLYIVSKKLGLGEDEQLHCVRKDSTMNTTGPGSRPIMSLFADPDGTSPQLGFAQVGYPVLFPSESSQQHQLLHQWLHVCDSEHGHGPEAYLDDGPPQMPTRLIYVSDSQIRLEIVQGNSFKRYLALSHCWGNGPKLCTSMSNVETFRKQISFNLLPLNFQDAIRVTRALQLSYLWIDSLCIIQDDRADWEREAARMGQVFSNAYCTIAATSASSSEEGFLTRQTSSPLSVTIQTGDGGTLYVSEFLEDYRQDLELAPLNTRGWVFQERALSRRTLHFAKTQVYWECGKGVHCERLFKLTNPQATLFGDSDFPKSILKYYKGGRITLFQNLYQIYSRRSFSWNSDRSVAIHGLEQRLLNAFNTRGGFGIFDGYLERSLLWSRQDDTYLTRIPYPESRSVPSWSWMAYQGPITYMDVPFNRVDWTHDYTSPFEAKKPDAEKASDTSGFTLKAFARDLTLSPLDLLRRVKFDEKLELPVTGLQGVVIGKDKLGESGHELVHYVLLVTPIRGKSEGKNYVRAGVAWLLERNIGINGQHVEIS